MTRASMPLCGHRLAPPLRQGETHAVAPSAHEAAAPFPVAVFPAPLRQFMHEVAAALPCPPDFVGVPLLAVLGTAIGSSRVLEVKPGWREGPRLFTVVVADPGRKKSHALALVMQPLRERQQQLQAAAQHARPAEEGHDRRPISDLSSVADSGSAPLPPPIMPQLYSTDATLEALIQLLHQNPRGLLFVRDELTAWVLSMNAFRRGKGSDRQTWLSFWNGAEIVLNWKTRHEVMVAPNPCVCVTGCLPPEVISDLRDPSQRADGLLDRMLFAFPEAVLLQWTDAGVTEATMAGYAEVLAALWQFEAASGPEVGHGARPVVMTLTAEGRAAFVRYVNDLYAQLADPELPDHLRGPYAKLEGYAARLALILHVC
jgi:hypothetical protein